MRCHRCGCVKVSIFLSKEPHFAQKRGSECHVHRCTMGFAQFEAQRLAQFSGFSIRVWNSEELIRLGPSEIPTLSSRNLGALAKALHKLHDLFTTAVRRSPQGCVSNRPMCSLSTWKSLTRHTAFYIASCQLHSSEVPIVVSCNH